MGETIRVTTKQYLNQIKRLDKMIENKLDEICRLREMAVTISANLDKDIVQTSGAHDKIGDSVAQIVDLENETNAIVSELADKKRTIVNQIDSMANDDHYEILTYKYVQKLEFREIFLKMKISERKMYTVYRQAIKEFERLYGKTYLDK